MTKLANSDDTKLENEVTNIDHIQEEKGTVGSIVSSDQNITTSWVRGERELVTNSVCLDDDPIVRSNSEISSFCCTICFKNFPTNRKLYLHMSYHGISSKCSSCNKVFSSRKSLLNHVRETHCEKKYMCEYCGKAFKQNYHLSRHLVSCSSNDKKKTRTREQSKEVCTICHGNFSTKSNLATHERRVHRFLLKKSSSFLMKTILAKYYSRKVRKTWLCNICHIRFKRKFDQERHMKLKHPSSTSSRITTSSGFIVLEQDHVVQQPKLSCTICTFKCDTFKELSLHKVGVHKGIKAFSCQLCDKTYEKKTSLAEHRSLCHRGLSFKCVKEKGEGGCGKIFNRKYSLQRHRSVCGKLGGKPFDELSRRQKIRRAKAKTEGFMQQLNICSGNERKLFLQTMARNYPEVLDGTSSNPLSTNDIIEVIDNLHYIPLSQTFMYISFNLFNYCSYEILH